MRILYTTCRFAETLPTSILIVRNGKILYANPAFLTFSGYLQDEIPGTDLLSLFDDPDQDHFKESLERGLEGFPNC